MQKGPIHPCRIQSPPLFNKFLTAMSAGDPVSARRARRISRQETQHDYTLKKYREYFLELNMNAEGKVYYEQLDAIIMRLNLELNVDDLKQALQWVEKDSCGMISFKTFFEVFTSIRSQNQENQSNAGIVPPAPLYPRVASLKSGGNGRSRKVSTNPSNAPDPSQYKDYTRENINGERKKLVREASIDSVDSETGSTGSFRRRKQSSETGSIASNDSAESCDLIETDMTHHTIQYQNLSRQEMMPQNDEVQVEPSAKPASALAQKKTSAPKRRVSITEHQDRGRKSSKENQKPENQPDETVTEAKPTRRASKKSIAGKEVTDGCRYFWDNDRDCDGKLSMREFTNMIDALGIGLNKGRVRQAFKQADLDGDGFIEFEEYVRVYINKIKSQTLTCEQIKEIFDENTSSRKGYLTKDELGDTLRMLGNEKLNDEHLDKFMAVIDKRKDGKVTFKDLCEFLGFEG